MNLYFLVPMLAAIGLLQTTFVPYLSLLGAKPNLMLLVVVAWTLIAGSREGLWWAFIGGLWLDLLGGSPLGASALALVAAAYLIGQGAGAIFRERLLIRVLSGLAAGLVYGSVLLGLLALGGRPADWPATLVRVIVPDALYNAMLLPVVYVLVLAASRRVGSRRWEV
ncbi:MAG: rod shape-determining protein MreD [Anaerolineae bacterium]|uniref:rod shape-determining protein MreD n=1 Tax=Candidatus Amarolinea dominans TaxID=3140696 RepID=UPI001D5725E7|nr:rod shape-determining protein MreD [Anaerolineae bacterium]MBK7201938.1 rod shape-determining protein MreD [Anaerolineae bacterium]MBK9096444.1 rod shape-determining protein MreD [Anaerolineae bacterium]MBK9233361.1 rod shape-determining protein MreD [Anaerolineae bacterium]